MFQKTGTKWDPLEVVIMSGELVSAAIVTAVFDSSALTATITWDGAVGEATDKALILVYDDESKRTVHEVEVDRSAGTVTIDASAFANVSTYNDIYVYLAFYHIHADGGGSNSNTTALKVTKT
jgi:predicted dinucleotide-utilizing enzyme